MVSDKTIDKLITISGNPLISISLPTHKKGEDVRQDPIRLKNLISQADDQLKEKGVKQRQADKMLKPAVDFLTDDRFWAHQEHGLVIYISETEFRHYQLPYAVDERAYVSDHFLITPLLPMVGLDGTFSVLSLSRSNPRLLQCTRNEVKDITPEDAPKSVDEYLEVVQEKELQFHSGAPGESAMFFGHGAGSEDKKIVVEQYFRELEKEITPILNRRDDPLILIGLDDNISFYKKANSYKTTMSGPIRLNPDELSDKELKDHGWNEIKDFFLKDMYRSLSQFEGFEKDNVSQNLSEIAESVIMGKTKAIFISRNAEQWGRYDADVNQILLNGKQRKDDIDILNWLAIEGRKTGTSVYVIPSEDMPQQAAVAAEFRF